jgi:hypothetical protein
MIEDSYASVVVSRILNGRSLPLMYVGIPAAMLGSAAAAAGSKDDDTSLHLSRTWRCGVLICAFSTDDHGNCIRKEEKANPLYPPR